MVAYILWKDFIFVVTNSSYKVRIKSKNTWLRHGVKRVKNFQDLKVGPQDQQPSPQSL